MKMLQF